MQNGLIEVRDTGALAALRLFKIEPSETFVSEIQGTRRTTFYFQREVAEKLLDEYFQRRLTVEARSYAAALREIRQEILKNKNLINVTEVQNGDHGKNG